ncbi:hypothetical protein IC614_03065 [Allosphingosinicella flava]|uniref:Uncharacterized protein n=1 Tax=Allosphingosinicella flava TaxID=2771430 RepID=A0A7T2LMX5_9SPHN|nr:hypothetical protein [Sphingosinicella flava]QPQ55597.1 hypothetical protein IC614_03065 [Sphingosinicella flava]
MALAEGETLTRLTRRDIASSGIGSDPKAIAAFEALQDAAFDANPAAAAEAQQTAQQADTKAETAQSTATDAATAAANAQNRADDAYDLADTKVERSAGPAWAAPSGASARTSVTAYTAPAISNPPTQAEVQALANALQEHSQAMVALITDLRANETLTP